MAETFRDPDSDEALRDLAARLLVGGLSYNETVDLLREFAAAVRESERRERPTQPDLKRLLDEERGV